MPHLPYKHCPSHGNLIFNRSLKKEPLKKFSCLWRNTLHSLSRHCLQLQSVLTKKTSSLAATYTVTRAYLGPLHNNYSRDSFISILIYIYIHTHIYNNSTNKCTHGNCAFLGYYAASSGNFLQIFFSILCLTTDVSIKVMRKKSVTSARSPRNVGAARRSIWRDVTLTLRKHVGAARRSIWRDVTLTLRKNQPSRFKHITSIICYLCFMQYAWRWAFFFSQS